MAEEALDPAAYIFEGLWTDWTKGQVLGLTWTLCPSKATLLTNSLALFVTLAGGQLWTIIRFSLHQLRAAHRPKAYSERFLQQQVILRNASTDLHTMRLMAQVGWASRLAPGRQFWFPLSIVLFALIHYTVFVAAGTLSNNLVNTGSEGTFSTKRINVSSLVLSRSPLCGTWSPEYEIFTDTVNGGILTDSLDSVQKSQEHNNKIDRNVQLSLEYAQDCYETTPNYYMSSKCDTFRRPSINFGTKSYTGACPFGLRMCHDSQDPIVFDSQLIDSHGDLGLNRRRNDRLTYRRRTTCAVLNDTGRIMESDKSTALAKAYANYGYSLLQGTNWTYSWSNFSSQYTEFTPQTTGPYQINAQIAYGMSSKTEYSSSFEPLPELKQDAADLFLFFLSFSGRYFEPVYDPWFSAHQLHLKDVPVSFARTQYERDKPISTLGCLEQHQFCTSAGICTPFLGWGQVQTVDYFNYALSVHQNVTFDRMIRALAASSIAQVASSLARTSMPLRATNKAAVQSTVLSLRLPDDQWRLELIHWHSVAMAQIQRTIAQWGSGQIATQPQLQLVPAKTEEDVWFCHNMMVPSTVYQSFSVVWLALLFTAGSVVILISWTIEDISDWFHLKTLGSSALRKIWDSYHMLRLTGFMMRNSWGPLPPAKDFEADVKFIAPAGAERQREIRVVPVSTSSPFSVRTPQMSVTGANHLQSQAYNHTSPIPRLWSELPPEPRRDTWVESSFNGFDFDLEGSPQNATRVSVEAKSAPPTYPAPSLAPRLHLLDLREHALARMQRGRG